MSVNSPLVKNTEKADKVVGVIRSGFGWFGVLLISVAYLAFSFVVVKEKEASILEIILRTGISFFVGFTTNRMLEIQGINIGLSNPDVVEVDKAHYAASKKLGKNRKKLQGYCKYINFSSLKEARENILSFSGLEYRDYFNDGGKFIGKYEKITKKLDKVEKKIAIEKNKHIKQAIKHKVTQVTPSTLLSDDVRMLDSNYLGSTIKEFTARSVSRDIIAKLAPAVIVGRIGVELATSANWTSFIIVLVEMSLYVLMGLIKLYNSYNFVTLRYRQRVINKTMLLDGIEDWVEPVEEKINEVKSNGSESTRNSEPEKVVSGEVTSRTISSSTVDAPTIPANTSQSITPATY
jgi:hypothetical protein